jgi:hypothetical protein
MVLRWPAIPVLEAIILRAQRSGPTPRGFRWQAILKARKAILPSAV